MGVLIISVRNFSWVESAGGNSAFFWDPTQASVFHRQNLLVFPFHLRRGRPKLHWPSVVGVHSATSTVAFEDVRGLFEDVG